MPAVQFMPDVGFTAGRMLPLPAKSMPDVIMPGVHCRLSKFTIGQDYAECKYAGRQQFSYEQYGDGRELFRDDRPSSRNSIQISSNEHLSSTLSESTKMLTPKMAPTPGNELKAPVVTETTKSKFQVTEIEYVENNMKK